MDNIAKIPKGTERQFLLAGNALFTLLSKKTGRRYTYKVVTQKYRPTHCVVKLLTGADVKKDYKALGAFSKKTLEYENFGFLSSSSYPVLAINYFLSHIDRHSPQLHVFHAGRCCFCGRLLTTPRAIIHGYGRKCAIANRLPYGRRV